MKTLFKAIVPGWEGTKLPAEFPLHVRVFLRASVVIAHLFSIRYFGLPFGWIGEEKRIRVIERLYHHRNPAIRNIVQFWKLTAIMTQC